MPIKQILSEQEAEHLRRQGLQVQAGDEVELNDAPQSTPTGSATDAASNAFMASSVPAAAGGLGFATGAALGVGLAPETGGLSLLLPLLFGGAGAYGGAKAGQAYTEAVLSDEAKQRLAMEAQQHPIASKVGSLATMPLGGMTPTPRSIVATLGGAGKLGAYYGGKMLGMGEAGASTAPVLTAVERQALINSAAGATLGPIQEAATAGLEGREITPGSLAESALIGAFANDATPILGKRMGFHPLAPGQMATEQGFRKTYTPPKIVAEPGLSMQQIKEDFLKKNKQEGEEGAAPTEKLRMVEGPTSKQPELNFGEKSLVQEELPMYEIPPEVREGLKNEFSKLPPEAYSARWNELLPHMEGLGLSPEAIATLQKEVFGPKGIKLKVSDNLGKTPEGESPIGRYTPGGKTVEVAPRADAPAIPAHEGFHEQWFNMTPEERGRYIKATKDELAQVNAERAKAGKKAYDPEEWFAMQGSVEHFRRGLNTRKESASQKWWNDTKAVFKQQFGKDPSADELLRAANFRLMNEKRGRFTPFGPAKDQQKKFATDEESPRYEQPSADEQRSEQEFLNRRATDAEIRQMWQKERFRQMLQTVDEAPDARFATEGENIQPEKKKRGRPSKAAKFAEMSEEERLAQAAKDAEELRNKPVSGKLAAKLKEEDRSLSIRQLTEKYSLSPATLYRRLQNGTPLDAKVQIGARERTQAMLPVMPKETEAGRALEAEQEAAIENRQPVAVETRRIPLSEIKDPDVVENGELTEGKYQEMKGVIAEAATGKTRLMKMSKLPAEIELFNMSAEEKAKSERPIVTTIEQQVADEIRATGLDPWTAKEVQNENLPRTLIGQPNFRGTVRRRAEKYLQRAFREIQESRDFTAESLDRPIGEGQTMHEKLSGEEGELPPEFDSDEIPMRPTKRQQEWIEPPSEEELLNMSVAEREAHDKRIAEEYAGAQNLGTYHGPKSHKRGPKQLDMAASSVRLRDKIEGVIARKEEELRALEKGLPYTVFLKRYVRPVQTMSGRLVKGRMMADPMNAHYETEIEHSIKYGDKTGETPRQRLMNVIKSDLEALRDLKFDIDTQKQPSSITVENFMQKRRRVVAGEDEAGFPEWDVEGSDWKRGEGARYATEEENLGMTTKAEKMLRDPEGYRLPINSKGAIDGTQLLNSFKNRLTPIEYDLLEKAGINQFKGQIIKLGDMTEWIKKNGPKVEVHSYGMEGKVSEAKKEYDRMTHEWYEKLPNEKRIELNHVLGDYNAKQKLVELGWSGDEVKQGQKYNTLHIKVGREPRDTSPRATSYYNTVSPLPTQEPMPEWTTSKEGKNVQRVDVVIPQPEITIEQVADRMRKDGYSEKEIERDAANTVNAVREGRYTAAQSGKNGDPRWNIKWQPDNLHENLPNTLGWAMIQYKTGPKGEKIAVIAEAQSRWQQQKREYWKIYNDLIAKGQHDPQEAHYKASTKVDQYRPGMDTTSNVEKDYNRLILKAAIEQARKEGATHIMVSDAETAMMTEGHDLNERSRISPAIKGIEVMSGHPLEKGNLTGEVTLYSPHQKRFGVAVEGKGMIQVSPEYRPDIYETIKNDKLQLAQEPGMRLNYDTILPKIAEELTGSKGEKVSLGEHKNAYNFKDQPWTLRDENGDYISNFATEADAWDFARNHRNKDKYTLKKDEGNIRTDLIFRNPDGTPKTDVSGVMYPLEQVSKRLSEGDNFTLFNKYATEDENLGAGRRAFFKPLESTFDKVNQIGLPKIAEAGRRWEVKRDMYVGKGNAALKDLSKFKVDDINRVAEARRKAFRSGSAYNPAGVDAEINNVFKQYYHDVIGKQRRLLGITIMGRKAGLNENYMPDTLAPEAIDTLVNKPATPEAKALINDWVKHIVTESGGKVTPKEAREYVEAYTNAVAGNDSNYLSVKYGAIRKAEGYGLPDSIREQDATQSLGRYARRAGADLAMFEELENKPEIAAALGLNDPKTGKTVTLPGVDNKSKRGEVRDMMKWVTGSFTGGTFARQSPRTSAVVRLVNNMLLGPATAVRDTASIPANMVPYLTEAADFSAVAAGIRKMHENARASLESGATQPNLDRTQFNDLVNSPDAVVSFTREAARYARLWQGREHIENFNRDLTFSIGKELAKIKVEGAKAGNVKAKQWLEKFDTALDGDVTKMSGADLEKAINTIAKNFTDRNQGTYGGRGLPVGIVDNQFAPFFALQKWSVEKSNVIWKDVVKPAIDGKNYLPLLTYTVGSVLTGAGIQQLNKLLSGRKSQDPELKEVLTLNPFKDPEDYAAQLATLMQLGSFAGIIGDAAKMTTDPLVYGKLPRNVVSFPTTTAAQDLGERIMNVSEAIRNGDDPVKVLSLFSLDLMSHNIQAARMIANRTAKADDIERSDKFRDLRTFQMLEGGKAPDFGSVNPYLNLEDKEFKRTDDLGVASQLAERMIQKKIEKAGGDYEKLSSSMRSASQNSYRTMPSLKDSPLSFQRYYNFLVETQGREEADRRMEEFLRQQMLNEVKSGMIPRI